MSFQGTVMGEMAGEVGAELVQRGRLQPRFEQALRFARPFEQGDRKSVV